MTLYEENLLRFCHIPQTGQSIHFQFLSRGIYAVVVGFPKEGGGGGGPKADVRGYGNLMGTFSTSLSPCGWGNVGTN